MTIPQIIEKLNVDWSLQYCRNIIQSLLKDGLVNIENNQISVTGLATHKKWNRLSIAKRMVYLILGGHLLGYSKYSFAELEKKRKTHRHRHRHHW